MSHSPPSERNYMDGVPIKISEKYKPPPIIHLPSKIIQKFATTKVPVAFDEDYNFDLERKIISKTSEWISWREREKSERQERIQKRDLARLKQLEEEQKQKLDQVSYPSTDDDDEELADEATNSHQEIIPKEKPFSPTNFNTILMPTQALKDPILVKKTHRRYASNSSNKIDFSFFESDTSPFDHLEMKSMNEMELLAQVLGSSAKQDSSEANNLERNSSSESESSDHQRNNNNVVPEPAPDAEQTQQPQYQQAYVPQMYNNYYGIRSSAYGGECYAPSATQSPLNFSLPNHQNQFLYPRNYAVNYGYNLMVNNNNTIVNGTSEQIDHDSKSKSVPSILKELNDELNNSEKRRIRNNSQNSSKEVPEQGKILQVVNVGGKSNFISLAF